MTQVSSSFETGVSGNSLSTGDAGSPTAFDIVQITAPGTLTYDIAHVYETLAAKVVSSSATTGIHFGWSTTMGTQTTTHYGRLYMYITAYPPNSVANVLYESSTPANAVRIRMNATAGTFSILDSSNTVKATSTAVANLDAWTRLEWQIVQGTGTSGSVECKIFLTPDSITPDETFSTGGCNTLANSASVKMGITGSNPSGWGTIWLDYVVAGATSYPGPVSIPIVSSNLAPVIYGRGAC